MDSKYGLGVEVKGKQFKVTLLEDSKKIDSEQWEDEGSLSQVLLVNIEKVLTRNNLKVKDLALGVEVDSNNESYTSARIAKVTSDMINFSLQEG